MTDCYLVILRISSFASIAFVRCLLNYFMKLMSHLLDTISERRILSCVVLKGSVGSVHIVLILIVTSHMS